MSSVLFPWMGTFNPEDLPQYADIRTALRHAGDLARLYGQRITFHPRWGSGWEVVVAVVVAAFSAPNCAASI
jgi:UV DNA damage repair endonuclease